MSPRDESRSPQGEDHEASDYHLLADASALAQCDVCRRQSWALDEVGATCVMPQPSGAVCGGEMVGQSDGLVAIIRHLSRVSPSRDGTVAVEDALEEARSVLLDVSRTRRSDAWGMVVNRANAWLAEFGTAAGEQTDHGGNQDDERRH